MYTCPWDPVTKNPKEGDLIGNVFLKALEAGSGGSRYGQGWLLLEALRETAQASLLVSRGLLAIQACLGL